jgi:HK97 family phage major capsid protein
MPSTIDLEARRDTLSKEINDLVQAAIADGDRDLTDDERHVVEAKEQQIEILGEEIKKSASDRIKQAAAERQKSASQRRSQPDTFTVADTTKVKVQEGFVSDPKKGFSSHREFLSKVMEAGRYGGVTSDKRLRYLATAGSDENSTISDPYGGFLVPQGFSPDVMSVMAEADPIGARTTKVPMDNAVVPINARVDKNHTSSVSGGLTVGRRVETQTPTSSRMAFEQVVLNAQSLFGLAYASEELLARSPQSFIAILEAGFRDEFPAKLIDERLNGTGTGMFEGVINAPCTISVTKETNQPAATIVWENVAKMRSRCWGYDNAIWLYNHDCLPQLMSLVMPVGTGGVPFWQPSARDGEPDRLLGRPAVATEFTQTIGTAGDLVLGNWSQYLEGTLQPMQQAESMHVRFENHERTFKFWVENDGRCWWRSALTPKRSSSTLSPFVILATRS